MAQKKKASSRQPHKKTAKKTPEKIKKLSRAKHAPKPQPKARNTARRKVDPETGKELSRRQYEKKYGRKPRAVKAAATYRHKFKLYLAIRDDYIEKLKAGGKKISKRDAMNSEELKKIIRDLHSKNPIKKAAALEKTGRITPDQIELYAQKFADED